MDAFQFRKAAAMDESERIHELDKLRTELLYRAAFERGKFVIDFAIMGIRSLVVINGGAIVAILTFLGHYQGTRINDAIIDGLVYLIAGLGCALITNVLAYLAQQSFSLQEHHGANKIFFMTRRSSPHIVKESGIDEDRNFSVGTTLQYAAISFAVTSFSLFSIGSIAAVLALKT